MPHHYLVLCHNIYIEMLSLYRLSIYRANDFPFGHFGLANPSISANIEDGGVIYRVINFTVNREGGTYGSVSVEVITTYNPVSLCYQN